MPFRKTRTGKYKTPSGRTYTAKQTGTHLVIETTQGDSRDIGLGGWVIRRKVNRVAGVFEPYPVEDEVMDDYELVEAAEGTS